MRLLRRMWKTDLEDEQRNRDGKHAIAERIHPAGAFGHAASVRLRFLDRYPRRRAGASGSRNSNGQIVPGASLEHEYAEAALRELFGNDRATDSGADDDQVVERFGRHGHILTPDPRA